MPGLLNWLWSSEDAVEQEPFVLLETSAPNTQFYNVRGWEVVDECEVLAETSQNEARSKLAGLAGGAIAEPQEAAKEKADLESPTSTLMLAKDVGATTPTTTKRSSANCRHGPQAPSSASDALERLAPTKLRPKKKASKAAASARAPPAKQHKGERDRTSTAPPHLATLAQSAQPRSPAKANPTFSYAAIAQSANDASAARAAAAAKAAEEEEAKRNAELLQKENDILRNQNALLERERSLSMKLKMKKTKSVPLAQLFQPAAPAPKSLVVAAKPAAAVSSWAQVAKA